MNIYLKYKKNGFIFGVPAKDLTQDEANIHGVKRLIDSGFYEFNKEDIVNDFNVDFNKPRKTRKSKEGE